MTTSTIVALVGCVKNKRPGVHAARDLYASPLFLRRRSYVESRGLAWYVLSAERGLVAPSDPLAPYERTLNTMTAWESRAWGERVLRQLSERLGDRCGATFEAHAGARYVEAIDPGVRAAGARLVVPTDGLGLGQQLRWYDDQARRRR